MEFKVLKHKNLDGVFGVIYSGDNTEIWNSSKPDLLGPTTNIKYLKEYFKGTIAVKQLNDYELISYILTEKIIV